MEAKSQNSAPYITNDDNRIIAQALEIIERRAFRQHTFSAPKVAGEFFVLRSHALEHEVFSVAYLDAQNRVIAVDEISRGTLTQASVYPREVVKGALAKNAAAVMLHHNHPSGVATPSSADEMLTKRLKTALELVDVRVLDHIITGGAEWYSMAEHGLI